MVHWLLAETSVPTLVDLFVRLPRARDSKERGRKSHRTERYLEERYSERERLRELEKQKDRDRDEGRKLGQTDTEREQ